MSTTHRKDCPRLYNIWSGMHQRVHNPNNPGYANYGGRGITICDEWKDFDAFYRWAIRSGYSDELTIDRIDNDQGYSPENCQWTTRKVQNNNRRSNRMLKYKGETKNIEAWATLLGMKRATIEMRLRHGWSIEKALETPVKECSGPTLLEYQSEIRSLRGWAAYKGLYPSTLRQRLELGWGLEQALETPAEDMGPQLLSYRGEWRTLKEWAAYVGLNMRTLKSRLALGWTIEEALETPLSNARSPRLLEYKGERKTLEEWAAYTGLSRSTLKSRLRYGWSVKETLETPIINKKLHSRKKKGR